MATENRHEQQIKQEDNQEFKKILLSKEDDIALKDKMYRFTYEALEGGVENLDTDLVDECVKTVALIDERETVTEVKVEAMKQKVDRMYLQWSKKEKRQFVNTKILTRAAICFIIVLMTSNVIANVFGYNIFRLAMQWSDETFHLGVDRKRDNYDVQEGIIQGEIYSTIDAILKDIGNGSIISGMIPEGFSFEYGEKILLSNANLFILHYMNEEKEIIVELSIYDNSTIPHDALFEKDDTIVEIYRENDIEYYIMQNNDRIQAVWSHLNKICSISGDITLDEIKEMINSMYGG